jgi:hypothetical protein
MPKQTFWVKERDALRWAKRLVLSELSELAIEFCARPEREWTGEEVAAILKRRIVGRQKVHPCVMVPGEELPANAVRLQIPATLPLS